MDLLWVGIGAYLAVLAAAICAGLTWLARRAAVKWRVLDYPHERGNHRSPVPLLGGVALAGALGIVVGLHLLASRVLLHRPSMFPVPVGFGRLIEFLIIAGGGIAMVLVGLWDDMRGVSVRKRLYLEFAVAAAVVVLGVRPELGFFPQWFGYLCGIVWLVGVTNSFNLVDGADGLAAGLGAISSAILGTVMLLGNQPNTAMLLFALAGACGGFLLLNWQPASIFMGSTGSMFIGYMLGTTTMVATFMTERTHWLFPLLVPLLVLAVPLYDTASVIVIRLRNHRSIFKGDRNHFHHRLMRMGFSHRQAVVCMWVISLAFGVTATLLTRTDFTGSVIVLIQAAILFTLIALIERVAHTVVTATTHWRKRKLRDTTKMLAAKSEEVTRP